MSATLGSLDAGSQVGTVAISLASATGTTYTLNTDEVKHRTIKTSGTATGSNDVVFPVAAGDSGMWWIVRNTSGQNIVCKVSGQTGITIATGKVAILSYEGGADITRVTADT
jgi:hypothetical protein